jgi:hypothetical protein
MASSLFVQKSIFLKAVQAKRDNMNWVTATGTYLSKSAHVSSQGKRNTIHASIKLMPRRAARQ